MSEFLDQVTRQQIKNFLPSAILQTLTSYEEFMMKDESINAKDFSAHHSACKSAISHLELLLKIAKVADIPNQSDESENILKDMLLQAEERVQSHKK